MHEWPRTLRLRQTPSPEISDEAFATAVRSAAANRGDAFSIPVGTLREACRAGAKPEDTLSQLLSDLAPDNDAADVLLALACVEVLRESPTADTWFFFWSMAWHSSSFERVLPRTVTTVAREDPSFKALFLEVASAVVKKMTANPGRRAIPRERELLPQLREDWLEKPYLSKIWWGLREANRFHFRDDDGIFGIVADLDLNAFIHLLTKFDNPYAVSGVLEFTVAGWSFSQWLRLFSLSPVAFDERGMWNGSSIVPLLLVLARDQILVTRLEIRPQAPDGDLSEPTAQIHALAGEIANAIAARPDARPCAERWATWLMRQCLHGVASENPPYPANARSHGYVDFALIDALASELRGAAWSSSPAADAESWEPWCYRCVLVIIAATGAIPMPGIDEFLSQWRLDPEDWTMERGQDLKEKSSLFDVLGKRADAYGTRLLAIPLAESSSPLQAWQDLWDMTLTIRDIVEFGDHDEQEDVAWQGQSAAAQLMRLVFGLGLMTLDCVVDPARNVQGDRQSVLEGLFRLLADAANEMVAIDRFNFGYWREANRHLAVRCAIWRNSQSLAVAFHNSSSPSFSDFLKGLSGDTENLLALIEVTLRNGAQRDFVRHALNESNTDLAAHIAFADRLIDLDKKRAAISEEQLKAARSLM